MRKLIKRLLPHPETLRSYKIFSLLGDTLLHPNLWHLNRRSAARGLAIGMFCGLIPGPLQMLGAAASCLVWRANLPLALVATIYTNPFTIIPIYFVAYSLGAFLLGVDAPFVPPEHVATDGWLSWLKEMMAWVLSLGKPLALGIPLLALILAIAAFFSCHLLWRWHVVHQWKKRHELHTMTASNQANID